MKNNAVILQHVYTKTDMFGNAFVDMLRLTTLRHMTYANGHNMDYWAFQGGLEKDHKMEAGAWAKIDLMKMALEQGYEYIFWIDADAAIMDFNTDLRDSVKDIHIGACVHDPAKSPFLKSMKIDRHINVGVMYLRNTDESRKFIQAWYDSYPGIPRWAEQGSFNNLLVSMPGIVTEIDDKWNATVNVNMVEKPVVKGYHGIMPVIDRFGLMRTDCIEDHIVYRV
jgi:hypothetical protein